MDASDLQCYCGKTYYQTNAFSNHQRHCKFSQQQLTTALSKAQQIWSKKRDAQRAKRIAADSQDQCLSSEGPALDDSTSNLALPSNESAGLDEVPQPELDGPMVRQLIQYRTILGCKFKMAMAGNKP